MGGGGGKMKDRSEVGRKKERREGKLYKRDERGVAF